MQPNAEQIMRQITKAALSALFAIGVTSPANIDKFVNHFSEELMKNYPEQPQPAPPASPEPAPEPPQAPKTASREDADISVIVKDEEILKILRASGLDTINKLSLEMQKRSLTEINGIEPRMEDELRESLKEWNKS